MIEYRVQGPTKRNEGKLSLKEAYNSAECSEIKTIRTNSRFGFTVMLTFTVSHYLSVAVCTVSTHTQPELTKLQKVIVETCITYDLVYTMSLYTIRTSTEPNAQSINRFKFIRLGIDSLRKCVDNPKNDNKSDLICTHLSTWRRVVTSQCLLLTSELFFESLSIETLTVWVGVMSQIDCPRTLSGPRRPLRAWRAELRTEIGT